MRRVQLPIPGVILGEKPERMLRTDSSATQPLNRWWSTLPLKEQHHRRQLKQRVLRIYTHLAFLRNSPSQTSGARLLQIRAELGQSGFASHAGDRCIALCLLTIEQVLSRSLRSNQIMAALAVLDGTLVELPTGEGKTLAIALAACVAALAGIPVHVITSNDYLAARDADALQRLANALGLSVAAVTEGLSTNERSSAYQANIVYCSAKELVFDYLKDSLHDRQGHSNENSVLRGLCMAIIDEADSVLLDEAITPFILSEANQNPQETEIHAYAIRVASRLRNGFDFRIDKRRKTIAFTQDGHAQISNAAESQISPLWAIAKYREEMVELALRALYILERDKDYLVQDKQIRIVDSITGRQATGRSWSKGLHQMLEIKERCSPTPSTRVLAQITFQRFFPRYLLLGGMSGTLFEARHELFEIYHLNVVRIPADKPSKLLIKPPLIAKNSTARWKALEIHVKALHELGRPVLIGTDSIQESEHLSLLLKNSHLPHQVLNARFHEEEAALIKTAGVSGTITVTTNMAGRGTDIHIDPSVEALGGLHIISCQLNSSRRIDRQLFGRAGRLGQAGSAQILLSLHEGLLRRYLTPSLEQFLQIFSNSRGFMPLVIGRLLLGFTQKKEERRGRMLRRSLREADIRQQETLFFGERPE